MTRILNKSPGRMAHARHHAGAPPADTGTILALTNNRRGRIISGHEDPVLHNHSWEKPGRGVYQPFARRNARGGLRRLLLLERGVNLAMPASRNLSSIAHGLHELRFGDRAGQVRIFYYIKTGVAIYLLHAFRKKTREMPGKKIALALQRMKGI
ncbi:MAG: type II toxin-antitoxin system RelE/ParE family toxin [Nitrospinae bacterium]|nr:type II toxin-antitoxin system RelE/ParE family toxin [Nitrospinota bacterium]